MMLILEIAAGIGLFYFLKSALIGTPDERAFSEQMNWNLYKLNQQRQSNYGPPTFLASCDLQMQKIDHYLARYCDGHKNGRDLKGKVCPKCSDSRG